VSLQIPILFQALLSEHYTKNGQTILIEQPEVHLHPTLQAKFIETLLSIGSKNTYFIETHSEHIIRKLQVLIKNEEFNIKPDDISIHYFRREPLKFKITEHKISDNGKLTPAFPSGFYDTSYSLVKQLL
jgi:predicted ATPase